MEGSSYASAELIKHSKHLKMDYDIVEDVKRIRRRDGKYELIVKWDSWEEENQTWQPFNLMREDIPGLVEVYLHSSSERILKRTGLEQLS